MKIYFILSLFVVKNSQSVIEDTVRADSATESAGGGGENERTTTARRREESRKKAA